MVRARARITCRCRPGCAAQPRLDLAIAPVLAEPMPGRFHVHGMREHCVLHVCSACEHADDSSAKPHEGGSQLDPGQPQPERHQRERETFGQRESVAARSFDWLHGVGGSPLFHHRDCNTSPRIAGVIPSIGILCYPTIGGSGRVATDLAARLAAQHTRVHLLSWEEPAWLPAGVRFHPVEVVEYPLLRYPPYDQALATQIAELHERDGVELFHAHYAIPHAVAVSLADQMLGGGKLRLVTTLHGTDITLVGSDPAYRRAVHFGLARSDVVTAVSESLRRDTRERIGFEGPIRVIANFVDGESFRPGTAPRWPARSAREPRRIVHMSTFRPVKRIRLLIEAVAILARDVPVRLTLVGDGPELSAALALAERLGLGSSVVSVGLVEDPAPWLRDADVYMFASETESFGLGVLEAMACGVPVVGPDVGGVSEVLGEPPAGRLVRDASAAALADSARALLVDAHAYTRIAERGRGRARSVFAPERIVASYTTAYVDALG